MVKVARYSGLAVIFLYFMVGGIAHFAATEMFVSIMPPYVPFHLQVVYLTGVMEIAAAASLLFVATRYWAGNFLFVFTIAVTPANVHMWLNPELFPDVEPAFLSIRLVLQVVLLAIIWFSTRIPGEPATIQAT